MWPIKSLPEEIREQKKRGDADEEEGGKKRRGGRGGGNIGISDLRRPVSPLCPGSVPVSPVCPHTSGLSHLCVCPAGWSTDSILSSTVNSSLQPYTTHNASVSPSRRPRRLSSASSPLVYSILVEDKQVDLIIDGGVEVTLSHKYPNSKLQR